MPTKKTKKHPPMYRQYRALKAEHPDALLLYRLGDFYELFEDDAELVARELGLTLTKRRFGKNLKLPMAGFPHRYINSYLARLIKRGHMVAVAEQLEDSRHAKGLVKRGVTRVVTSGTVMDDTLLQEYRDNFLLAVVPEGNQNKAHASIGLACLALSTGEFTCTQLAQTDLAEELARLRPSEVIVPDNLTTQNALSLILAQAAVDRISPLDHTCFSSAEAERILKAQFNVASLEAFSTDPLALQAAAAMLHYLHHSQTSDLAHITSLNTYHLSDYLTLDSITRRNLELTRTLREGKYNGSLLATLNQTQTRMGGRLLRRWISQPLADRARIEGRLSAVETLVNDAFLREDVRSALKGMYDLERIAGRIGYGNANARDLINLKATLSRVPSLNALLAEQDTPRLRRLNQQLNPLAELSTRIQQALVDEPPILLTEGGLIKDDYDPELDRLRRTASEGRAWLTDYEASERQRTGIKNLRLKYNSVFGFFLEVTKSNLNRVPDDYHRRATVSTGERFNTPELKTRETEILNAEDAAHAREHQLFIELRHHVAEHLHLLRQTAQALAQLDVFASLAEVAALHNYTKPTLSDHPELSLHHARHPVVEQSLPSDTPFVPNHCHLSPDQRLIVLTGPNMSGKSVYLRQTALITLMAHLGAFVPAEKATIGLTDRIFARAGASDDISQGRSTFLVEMSETAHILHHATERSLIILDEVGRGTSTYDGLSLAWAVAEDLHRQLKPRCLFATHFHELTELGDTLPGAANYAMQVQEQAGDVIFLRQVQAGGADRSYGIHVARLAGLPQRVLKHAEQILSRLQARTQSNLAPQPNLIAETETEYRTEKSTASPPNATNSNQSNQKILADLSQLDIANLTPLEALMTLHQWQQQLKQSPQVPADDD